MGRCIYCGSTEPSSGARRFGDEHVVPLALNGALVLPEASCKSCERVINKEIETQLLTDEWSQFRAKYGLPTRRPKNRPKTVVLGTLTGGQFHVPVKEYTAPVPLYRFSTARILSGAQPVANSDAWTLNIFVDGDEEVRLQHRYPHWDRKHIIKPEPYRFARFIAKVAYGFRRRFDGFALLPTIG